jgi:HD-GYP domain-containing protein (c-di-GMP phosphodiesterase class II)
MRLRITIARGPGAGQAAEVPLGGALVVGRGPQCDLQILDEGLSRTHCRFFWEEDMPFVEDMGSRNGTSVNGARIRRHPLQDGQLVGLGTVDLKVDLKVDLEVRLADAKPSEKDTRVRLVESPTPAAIGVKKRVALDQTLLFSAPPAAAPELKRLQRDLATVYKVVNLFGTENGLDRLFGLVMDTIMEVTGADRGTILFKPEDGTPPRAVAVRVRGRGPGRSSELPVSRTIVEEGLKGLSLITADAMLDERFKAGASIVMQNIHAAMCVPLESHDKVLGVIYVDTTGSHRHFSESDLELLTAVGRQAGIAIQRASYLQETKDLFYSTVLTLAAAIEAKDRYTKGHSERVTAFSVAIAESLGLSGEEVHTVRLSALLHDVGKIGVPEAILNKQGKLTPEEYTAIQAHPHAGAQIIRNIPKISPVLEGVRHHHEKWNGKGYPDHLAGEAIPRIARIIAVADAYDAMSSHRAYRKGLPGTMIFEEIRKNAGIQFDPVCVEAFFRAIASGKLPAPEEVLAQQAAYHDRLVPPEHSDAQGVQPPPDVA